MKQNVETISETETKFYGYLVGLSVGHMEDQHGKSDIGLYALFHYGNKDTTYIVPDLKLFKILSRHLNSMAWHNVNVAEGIGYDKLWIGKEGKNWEVSLP